MDTSAGTLHMTLSDVALLARVQRPVVSMWRKRSSGSVLPFPAAAAWDKGVELFDARDVTDWLQATGRGNNPEARKDVAFMPSSRSRPPRPPATAAGRLTD